MVLQILIVDKANRLQHFAFMFLFQLMSPDMWASQVELLVKNLTASARDSGDLDSVPGLGRSPGEGNGNPL